MADIVTKAAKVTGKLSQEQLIHNVADRFATEMTTLNTRCNSAISIFRSAANELDAIIKDRNSAISNAQVLVDTIMMEIDNGKAANAEDAIIRDKMLDIISGK